MLRFGQFALNPVSGELRKAGIPVKIGPQPLRVLLLLAERPRQIVTRMEIQRCLWGDNTFVDYERGINFCVNQIRAALCDEAEKPRFIETLPRRGYRFIAPVSRQISAEPAPAVLPIDIPFPPAPIDHLQALPHPPELQVMPQQSSREHRGRWIFAGAVSLTVVVSCVYWLARRVATPTRESKTTQITANSADDPVTSSAISPDGKYLAFTDHSTSIRIRLLATGDTQAISEPDSLKGASVDWTVARWFPDSARLIVNARSPASFTRILDRLRFGITLRLFDGGEIPEERSIWIVSKLGGPPQKLRDDAEAFSVSPDGSLVAFGTRRDALGDHEIWLMDSKGQQARKLMETPGNLALAGFNWSPDGRRAIYFQFGATKGQILSRDLERGSTRTILSFTDPHLLNDLISLPDGRLIYAQSNNALDRTCNLWELRTDLESGSPNGRPRQLTNWSGFCAGGLSTTTEGGRLAFRRTELKTTINIADTDASGTRVLTIKHLTLNEYVNSAETWTPDSKALIFRSIRNGRLKLFKQALDSDPEEPLVSGADDVAGSAISPDGSTLYYLDCGPTTDECGDTPVPLMQIPISGGTRHQVLISDAYGRPRCAVAPATVCVIASQSDDRKLITFKGFDTRGPGADLAKFESESTAGYAWTLSSDGTRIAVVKRWGNQVHVIPLNAQSSWDVSAQNESHFTGVDWAADGKGWFIDRMSPSGTALVHVDLRGQSRQIWELKGDTNAHGIPSPDGRHLAIVETVRSSNVWLLEDF